MLSTNLYRSCAKTIFSKDACDTRASWQLNYQNIFTTRAFNARLCLNIVTMKRHSGVLATTAQVQHKHTSANFYTYEPFKDYNKQLLTSNPARCTRQLVEAQHERVMQNLDVIIDAVENHYGVAV